MCYIQYLCNPVNNKIKTHLVVSRYYDSIGIKALNLSQN